VRRTLRFLAAGWLGLALAAAAAAQVRVLPPSALAPLGVPALLMGTPAAPPPALAAALSLQTLAIAPLPAPEAAAYLIARAAAAAPAERAAAMILAARLTAPRPASAPARAPAADMGLRELAASARTDPALAAWFDGGKTAPLELDGLELKRGSWRRGAAPLERLGQGEFGFVDVHPTIPGAVVKTVEHSAEIQLFSNASHEDSAVKEEETSRALADADAGPRHFGRAVRAGRRVSVRERVFGETLEQLGRGKRLGPAERELVLDLLRRMGEANTKSDDMRPSNVMIGRTLLDPRRRAYVVDGGNLSALPAGLDAEGRVRALLDEPIVLRARFDPNMGWIEKVRTMRQILDEGVERASRTTRWLRFKGFWKDFGRAMAP
jgi:hypothetical protein